MEKACSFSGNAKPKGMTRSMAQVILQDIVKQFGKVEVVHGISLDIADKEFVVLVGPSGCGKSTVLRMVAGLEKITSGSVSIGERVVNDVAPKDRDVAMVFQNYALYPHMNVFDNMSFGLKLSKTPKSEILSRVTEAASCSASPTSFPADSASGWPWAAPSCANRPFFCSMSRFPTSTPS
jgi:ABC-type Fe3+/spermidine/putrescine transport system ATPase subunit